MNYGGVEDSDCGADVSGWKARPVGASLDEAVSAPSEVASHRDCVRHGCSGLVGVQPGGLAGNSIRITPLNCAP